MSAQCTGGRPVCSYLPGWVCSSRGSGVRPLGSSTSRTWCDHPWCWTALWPEACSTWCSGNSPRASSAPCGPTPGGAEGKRRKKVKDGGGGGAWMSWRSARSRRRRRLPSTPPGLVGGTRRRCWRRTWCGSGRTPACPRDGQTSSHPGPLGSRSSGRCLPSWVRRSGRHLAEWEGQKVKENLCVCVCV